MPTRITVIHRVVIAVGVKVQTVYRLGIKITRIIRRDESAPSRGVVARIEEVQPGVLVVVIAAVSDRVPVTGDGSLLHYYSLYYKGFRVLRVTGDRPLLHRKIGFFVVFGHPAA